MLTMDVHPGSQEDSTVPRKKLPFLLQSLFEPSLNIVSAGEMCMESSSRITKEGKDIDLMMSCKKLPSDQSTIHVICVRSRNTILNRAASYRGGIPTREVSSLPQRRERHSSLKLTLKVQTSLTVI